MGEFPLQEAFELLGVRPGDGLIKVRQAYQRQKDLYAEDALASYALLTPELRQSRLERIENAYQRIVRELAEPPAGVVFLHTPSQEPAREAKADEPLPGPDQPLGSFLKLARERAGLSLQEIALRSKIGTRYLEGIETGRFDLLPAAVYLRGFVEQYAQLVGLPDPRRIADCYLEWRQRQEGPPRDDT